MLILKLMEKIEFFSEFSDDEKLIFVDSGSFFKNYEKDEYIIKEGVKDDCSLFILLKGKVTISKKEFPNMVLGVLEKGDIIGEASFLSRHPRTASAVAQEDVTVFKVEKNSMAGLDCPLQLKIKDQLFEILIHRMNSTNNAMLSMLK
ncbi:MAG: cyclic nucleotide-binding domain-containing protein [Magnetococcales bacterium]|nr:cyclic nucleotide-binding domain-containing protein [Magnetococcales bacterium]